MCAQEIVEKVPPQSLEAEAAVLGSMLLDRSAISQSIEILDASYFYRESHKKIYSAIIKLYDENKAVDLITLIEELKKTNSLDEVGGPAYITSLASSVPTAANLAHYARIE